MTTSLMDSLKDVANQDLVERLATSLGEPSLNVRSGLVTGMASMLVGIVSKSGDTAAMQGIFETISSPDNDGHVLDDPAALVGSSAESPVASLGREFLSEIFGSRCDAVYHLIAKQSGLRFGSVSSIMKLSSTLVLGVLGRRVRDGRLSFDSFTKLLSAERDGIQRFAPPGLLAALGAEQRSAEDNRPFAETPSDAYLQELEPAYRSNVGPSGRSWAWPIAIAAGVGLVWGLSRGHRVPTAIIHDTTTVSLDSATASSAAGDVSRTLTSSGMTPLRLPDGRVIEVPAGSSEAKLFGYLTDVNQTSDTTWFGLDELHFADNSARLEPDGNAQLGRLAAIMKAYPTTAVMIAGFTDNTGNEAHNRKLSHDRADAARDEIVKNGVDASRISTQGYGSELPRADNSTEEGRALNRRVAVLVVKK